MKSMIDAAIQLAATAHEGQVDKAGAPYIMHPIRVSSGFMSEDAQVVAILHDVVEDTWVTLDVLRGMGFSDLVIDSLDALTRREGETYRSYLRRVREKPLARMVKLADLRDNLIPWRVAKIGEGQESLMNRYRDAIAFLNGWKD